MYPTYNEGKSVVAERVMGTLENKIYKDMNSINVHIDKLDDTQSINIIIHIIVQLK